MKHVCAVTLLPILTRELREAARKPGTFRMRMAVPTLAFLVVTAGLLLMPAADAVRGRAVYQLVGLVALLYAMLGGILLTADSIAGEREQGTLGLLFLTPLRARGILLGKLAATSLHGIYAMVGLLPLLSVPLMLGGVGLAEIVAHSLLLIATLALSLGSGCTPQPPALPLDSPSPADFAPSRWWSCCPSQSLSCPASDLTGSPWRVP